jgi:hypothetical protein
VNKFEALKQFMAWPPEWQRLCAEYWIETGEDRPAVQVWTTADKIQAAGELVQRGVALPMPGDPWPFDQPKAAAKVASTQGCTPIYRGEFGIIEREYLAKCHHETSTRRDAANMFLDRYPGRSVQAVEIKIRKMLDASGVMHVRY